MHEIYHQSLQMGGLNILLDQVTIQSSTEWQQFQEEEFEDLSLIRSTWEDGNFFVVTQKWDEDSARIKKQSLAYWESRAKVWMNFV